MTKGKHHYIRRYKIKATEFAYHWHNSLAILHVLNGAVELRIRAENNALHKDDIFVINPGEVHRLKAITEDNLVSIVFFDDRFCNQVDPEFNERAILVNSFKYEAIYKEKYLLVKNYLNHLYEALDSGDEFKTMITSHQMLVELCYKYDFVTCGRSLELFSDKVVQRNKTILREAIRFDSPYHDKSLKEIASLLGLSYSHLRKDILTRYGYGYKWLKYSFMTESAAKQIAVTNLPITIIGEQCGFSDPKYLIQYFRIYYEMTPSEFRKHFRENTPCYHPFDHCNLSMEWATEIGKSSMLYR